MMIYACSTNAGKLKEFSLAAHEFSIPDLRIQPLPSLAHISPPDETGATFEENASIKASYYSRFTDKLVIADDSGLVVKALNGAPGIYSSRYAGPGADSVANNMLLLRNLAGAKDRSAAFVCVVCLARSGEVLTSCRGTVNGTILDSPRIAPHGFGYDPLFFYPQLQASFADLNDQQKFAVSHRGAALRKLFYWIQHSRSRILQDCLSPVH